MGRESDATRAERLAQLSKRNRAALKSLHVAAQAISDDDPDYAQACMADAVRHLRPALRLSCDIAGLLRLSVSRRCGASRF
jgi:hypothetical protein